MRHSTHLVIMGVAGVGKSTIAAGVAKALGWAFADADDFHSAGNLAKMRSGAALNTADREPWLESIRLWIDERGREGISTVTACSVLRREYRDVLQRATGTVAFVHLVGSRDIIARRMASRPNHFMPVSLLVSQFEQLEPLEPDESGISIDTELAPDEIVKRVVRYVGTLAETDSTVSEQSTEAQINRQRDVKGATSP